MKTLFSVATLVLLASSLAASLPAQAGASSSSANSADTLGTLNAEARRAYQQKDYAQFLILEKRALQLSPGNPRLMYNVACGEALQGNPREAVRRLDQLVALKLDMGAEKDDDFSGIRKTEAWAGFESRLAQLRKPIVRSTIAFRLTDPDLLATGIAVDSRNGDTYIASVRERKIVRRSKDGTVSDFISPAQDGFLAGDSLALDTERNILFASTATAPFMTGYQKGDAPRSGVFAFDLKSGKLLRKALLPDDGKQHFLNALALDHNGNVYVSDSAQSGIYRIVAGKSELETFLPGKVFRAAQGLAFSSDEKVLYIADYSDGVWALDMVSKKPRALAAPKGVWLGGLDGLTRVPDGFIAVQIGVQPQRVLHLRLDPGGENISAVDIMEMNHPDYDGPIQGTVANGTFLYVANSQLELGNGQTGAFAAERARPTVVLRLPI
jgi:sugar lactone lactonase YvrE